MPVSQRIARERQERYDRKMAEAAERVPEGMYCYSHTGRMVERSIRGGADGAKAMVPELKPCPYLKIRKDKPEQRNGYCRLLKAGDWMPAPRGTMLLWDACKECGINMGSEDDGVDAHQQRSDILTDG